MPIPINTMIKYQNMVEKLIAELCPNGVEFKVLTEIATVNGAGVDKKIQPNEKLIKLLNYMDVYRNRYLDKSIPTMEVTANDHKIEQCNVLTGDIFFTPTSEVLNDIGNSAVAIEDMYGVVYSYHIMRIRLHNRNITTSMFISYILESDYVQNQINKSAKGITRFGLTKTQWEKIKIPIPPLAIQEEIVKILNSFTELEVELEVELEARKKQYEYYRGEVMTFGNNIELKELASVCLSTQNIKWQDNNHQEYQYIDLSSVSRENNQICETSKIDSENAPSRAKQIVHVDDVIFGTTRPTLKRYSLITSEYHNQICSTGFCVLRPNTEKLLPKFLFFILKTPEFYNYIESNQAGASYPSISDKKVKQFKFPIPPIEEQKRIVSILDKFDSLVNDISIGLPAELKARRQQYEYYRGKLLTFKEKEYAKK